MSELTNRLRVEFRDEETRHIYADDFLNTYIASQLKVLREDRNWTQRQLAERAGMRQERISVLEDVNYEAWSVRTLKRLAQAFDLRLSIKFESFGSFLTEFDQFRREILTRPSFEDDPAFSNEEIEAAAGANDFEVISSQIIRLATPEPSNVLNFQDFKQAQRWAGNEPSKRDEQRTSVATLSAQA
ncbi:MAG TPA: helix-turn-helix transcriptional regulator [Pyrinomonadaceae bacterium]|nr:helix-turn-helix transcriptional regulator [Pyrinomonadaceae bacterium]